eukprot:431801-Rhodomonas_salina.1
MLAREKRSRYEVEESDSGELKVRKKLEASVKTLFQLSRHELAHYWNSARKHFAAEDVHLLRWLE